MRRCLTQIVVAAATMSLSLPALAQSKPGCPPGSWFCADISVAPPAQAAPAQKPRRAQQPPPQEEEEAAPPPELDEPEAPAEPQPPPARPARRVRRQAAEPPPVVVYQPVPEPPPQVIVVTPGHPRYHRTAYAVPPPPPAAPRMRWQPEFGLNLRVEGVALGGRGASGAAGMGGVGLSLRYRPVPAFAFDLGVDVLAGHDYNGFQRVEVPVTLNGLLYLNPRSRVQVYLLGGAHISRAQVRSEIAAPQLSSTDDGEYGANYTYFGGQGGGGFEFRVSRRVALNLDVVGFVRKRIDDGRVPEFIDYRTGRTTDTSGGALFRGGLVFWW